jgi:hypothetical protein
MLYNAFWISLWCKMTVHLPHPTPPHTLPITVHLLDPTPSHTLPITVRLPYLTPPHTLPITVHLPDLKPPRPEDKLRCSADDEGAVALEAAAC